MSAACSLSLIGVPDSVMREVTTSRISRSALGRSVEDRVSRFSLASSFRRTPFLRARYWLRASTVSFAGAVGSGKAISALD